ncbi:lipopolysaccharide biosynthesis protein [Psychromonas sp. RZ22]|uniref:lipopolysaccharide biosynthesis protein n=1 Tax=Psychromonas algarum TaxID=2555643 RepID=UPI001067F6E6|nr:lipopolysaccharide biosynthesis protein [Psychromonas sp. RZ22]TEW55752.1 lipopolysaccharide biosynthesis protein [Psychromonas sp. RZ22]
MIKSPLYSAILKSVSGRLSTYIVQFASLAIYARLFTPEEFGIMASIQVFVIFFQMIADFGIGPAIINEEECSSNKRDGIFTVTAIIGSILAIIFFFFSYLLNSFYSGYEYQNIAFFVCLAIFFSTLNIVPMTSMNKDTKFIHLAAIDIFVECLSLTVVYVLYSMGFGLLALATRPATQSTIKFLLTWFLSLKTELGRPYLGCELYHIKSILSFSLYQFAFNFINYFSRNLDNILIAKYFGMASVGLYQKSYQLMRYPLMVTTFAMAPAIQPILTKVRNDKNKVIREHNLLTSRLLALSLPISFFMFVNSYNLILFLLGEQWLAIEPLIKIFTLMIPIQAVLSTSGSFFQVMNQPRLLFIAGALAAIVNVTAIITGIILGKMEYVAFYLVIAFSINFFCSYHILFQYCFRSRATDFYLCLLKVLALMALPIALYYIVNVAFLSNYHYSAFVDLLVNFSFGLISIALFFVPIKKILK